MKKYIALLFLSLGFFTACDMVSGEGEGAENAVYMGNTNSSGVISMVVSNDKGAVLRLVRHILAQRVKQLAAMGMCLINGYEIFKDQTHSPHKRRTGEGLSVAFHLMH